MLSFREGGLTKEYAWASYLLWGLITQHMAPQGLCFSLVPLFMGLFIVCKATWFILSGVKIPRKCNFNILLPDAERCWSSWKIGYWFLPGAGLHLHWKFSGRQKEAREGYCLWRSCFQSRISHLCCIYSPIFSLATFPPIKVVNFWKAYSSSIFS